MMLSPWSRTDWGTTDWDPFSEIRRLQSDMYRLLDGARMGVAEGGGYPPVNLWLGVVVTAELPGLTSDDIDLSVKEDLLLIQGRRAQAANDNEVSWHRRERPVGSFARTVELPFRVDSERVQARFANGVLEVYSGGEIVKRFIKIDKLSTATSTQGGDMARPYRFAYGVLDSNLNGEQDANERKVYFEISDYSTNYVFYGDPGS